MYITIEGPIGVGKSSLTNIIAQKYNYKEINEIVEENPFLKRFYDVPDRWAFQTEMFFLTNRYDQLNNLNTRYLYNNIDVVADYDIQKNLIFARKTLGLRDFKKFEHIFEILTENLPVADLTIFLTASIETLFHRIILRGREFEEYIDADYLNYLIDAYNEYIVYCQNKFPDKILIIDCDLYDFVNNEHDQNTILSIVEEKIKTTRR